MRAKLLCFFSTFFLYKMSFCGDWDRQTNLSYPGFPAAAGGSLQLSTSETVHTQPKMASKILACDFEVFGIVQGVFFRKYTEKQAKSLGVRGWCMNTSEGTVKGQLEGTQNQMNEMKNWLKTKGSPTSRIDKAVFSESKEITDYTFSDFAIKR